MKSQAFDNEEKILIGQFPSLKMMHMQQISILGCALNRVKIVKRQMPCILACPPQYQSDKPDTFHTMLQGSSIVPHIK
jgi:hypothetical protein